MFLADPLKINYVFVLETDDPFLTTPFQGFSFSWEALQWAFRRLATLPADISERNLPAEQVIAQRMGGARSLDWTPLNVSALSNLDVPNLSPFVVCFSGEASVCERIEELYSDNEVLHVSTQLSSRSGFSIPADDLSDGILLDFCRTQFERQKLKFDPERRSFAATHLSGWEPIEPQPVSLIAHGHNTVIPNHMSLVRAFRKLEDGEPFIAHDEPSYTKIILESVSEVEKLREYISIHPIHRLTLLRPGLILFEPSLFREKYPSKNWNDTSVDKDALEVIKGFRAQKTLHTAVDEKFIKTLQHSATAQTVAGVRKIELLTLTHVVGLRASESLSAVMRLSPGVNHVFNLQQNFSQSVRSGRPEARLKSKRLFEKIQGELSKAIGDGRLKKIQESERAIKIVSDAPLEWLPVGNLPLCLSRDCSRVNATPGNLAVGQLAKNMTITLPPQDFQSILIISSFRENDPIRNYVRDAVRLYEEEHLNSVLKITLKTVSNSDEFVAALNEFSGNIVIFDGHGVDNSREPIGKIMLGEEEVDIWQLRGKARIPPIVTLSACDTHGLDASSHATVGNGFLALGALTVVATLLPVRARDSAGFLYRLFLRLEEFLPIIPRSQSRVLTWTEVISGMLRMFLASEILDKIVGPPSSDSNSDRYQLQLSANIEINDGTANWFDKILEKIAASKSMSLASVSEKAAGVIARSDAIRYIQLGNPELILIDDGSVQDSVMNEYDEARKQGQGSTPQAFPEVIQ